MFEMKCSWFPIKATWIEVHVTECEQGPYNGMVGMTSRKGDSQTCKERERGVEKGKEVERERKDK